jgi:hypothetical protein
MLFVAKIVHFFLGEAGEADEAGKTGESEKKAKQGD